MVACVRVRGCVEYVGEDMWTKGGEDMWVRPSV